MTDPVTEQWLADEIVQTLDTWLPGYSDLLGDGRQRRIVAAAGEGNDVLYVVQDFNGDLPERRFKVHIGVQECPPVQKPDSPK